MKAALALIVIVIFIYMTCMGIILTTSYTLAIDKQPHRAGSASALLGMSPLIIGAIVAPLVGITEKSAVPMAVILFATSIIALLSFLFMEKETAGRESA